MPGTCQAPDVFLIPHRWQADNITALDTLMAGVVPLATKFRSFDGLAVFHTALWRASALAGLPSPTGNPGNCKLAGWYVPTEAIFGTNGSAVVREQLQFLHWAVATNITVFYAQDFVGAAGVVGIANATDAFCAFIQQAHRFGIDVHLYGALPLLRRDLMFIDTCKMPPLGPLPPVPPAPSPCAGAIASSCVRDTHRSPSSDRPCCQHARRERIETFVAGAGRCPQGDTRDVPSVPVGALGARTSDRSAVSQCVPPARGELPVALTTVMPTPVRLPEESHM